MTQAVAIRMLSKEIQIAPSLKLQESGTVIPAHDCGSEPVAKRAIARYPIHPGDAVAKTAG
jgi:hypothetical protein